MDFDPKTANNLLSTARKAILGATDLNLIGELIERTGSSESDLVLPGSDLWLPNQSYYGGINPKGLPLLMPNGSPIPGKDPIARDFKPKCPIMVAVKSLRALLLRRGNPEEVTKRLDSTLGFGKLGELAIDTTGFMPKEFFMGALENNPALNKAMKLEGTMAFKGSGGMDHLAALAIVTGSTPAEEDAVAELEIIVGLGVTIN